MKKLTISRIIEILLVGLWIYSSFFSEYSKTSGIVAAVIIYSIIFLLPVFLVEVIGKAMKKRRESSVETTIKQEIEEEKQEDGVSIPITASLVVLWISGIMAIVGIVIILTGASDIGESLPPTIFFGIIALIAKIARNKRLRKDGYIVDPPELTQSDKDKISILNGKRIISVVFMVLVVGMYMLNNWNSLPESITRGQRITVKNIEKMQQESYELEVDKSVELEVKIKPVKMTEEDVLIYADKDDVVKIENVTFSNKGDYTILNFTCMASQIGETNIIVEDVNKNHSISISVAVVAPPTVSSIKLSYGSLLISTESIYNMAVYLSPNTLTLDDVVVKIGSQENIVSIQNLNLGIDTEDAERCALTFDVCGCGLVGEDTIVIEATDGRTKAKEIKVTVVEPYLLRTVYVNSTGDKYHYSSSCAGKTATSTTLYQAKKLAKKACSKCAQ